MTVSYQLIKSKLQSQRFIYGCQFPLYYPKLIIKNLMTDKGSITVRIHVKNMFAISCLQDNHRRMRIKQKHPQLYDKLTWHIASHPDSKDWQNDIEKYSKHYVFLKNIKKKDGHGCFLSHIKLLENIYNNQSDNYVIIFEDNFDVLREIPNTFEIPHDSDMIMLHDKCLLTESICCKDYSRILRGYGTYGYIIKVSSIPKILAEAKKINKPIDLIYVHLTSKLSINLYVHNNPYITRAKMPTSRISY